MDEVIPVAIITGGRLPRVLRQVHQMRAGTEGDTTPIIIVVDGYNAEAKALASLIQVAIISNTNNTASPGIKQHVLGPWHNTYVICIYHTILFLSDAYITFRAGTNSRINIQVKFALTNVFKMYPEVDKLIILEDDLQLSPDFIS